MEETHCLPLSGGANPQIADIAKPEWHGDIKVHTLNPKYQTLDLSRICLFLEIHGPNVSPRHILLTLSLVLSLNCLCKSAWTRRHTRHAFLVTVQTTDTKVTGLRFDFILCMDRHFNVCLKQPIQMNMRSPWSGPAYILQTDFQTTTSSRLWSGRRCHCWGRHTTAVCPSQDNAPHQLQ